MVCPANKKLLKHVFTLQGNHSVVNVARVGMNCIFIPVHILLLLNTIRSNRRKYKAEKRQLAIPLPDADAEESEA
jgi:hypothetical protein